MKIFIYFIAIATLIFIVPFATINSINTLFGTDIPMTVNTWFSALWLGIIVGGGLYQGVR